MEPSRRKSTGDSSVDDGRVRHNLDREQQGELERRGSGSMMRSRRSLLSSVGLPLMMLVSVR